MAVLPGCDRRTSDAKLVSEIKQCGRRKDLSRGKVLHMNAEANGRVKSRCVSSALISMYSKCGIMEDAHKLFDNMVYRDVVSWTVLILGYVDNGNGLEALDLFERMDCPPDALVFVSVLKACARVAGERGSHKDKYLERGIDIHRKARQHGFDEEVCVANTLIDMYSKCGDMTRARCVFDRIKYPSVVALSALIMGYVENGDSRTALCVFNTVRCPPDRVLVVAGLKACAALAKDMGMSKELCLTHGTSIHKLAIDHGLDSDMCVSNTLVDMYSKCGSLPDAVNAFKAMRQRDVVSWNNVILAFVDNGHFSVALEVFDSMDCPVNSVSLVAALRACGEVAGRSKVVKSACLQRGLRLHKQATETGFIQDIVLASALIDVYRKCGEMSLAKETFDGMPCRDVVAWNALVLGYVENGESLRALELFEAMDCAPDRVTCIAALKACASLGALERGQRIHARACELKLEQDEAVASCLVDFYGKCGDMAAAEDVFQGMRSKCLVSWNALIGGYALLGDTPRVFSLVKRMQECGQEADSVTVLLVLSACSHAGMVVEGQRWFESMAKLNISPTIGHYACMVDMLCRANKLQEAVVLIREMPFEADTHLWLTLLGACRSWKDEMVGQAAFHELLVLKRG